MLNEEDKQLIRETFLEVVNSNGEDIVRRRTITSPLPSSFDQDFGEVEDQDQVTYEELSFKGKVFWSTGEAIRIGMGEDFLMDIAGRDTDRILIVLAPYETDIQLGDELQIRGKWYRVWKRVEAPLKGFNAFLVESK